MRATTTLGLLLCGLLAGAAGARAGAADDDLALVKRALQDRPAAAPQAPAGPTASEPAVTPRPAGAPPQWLRVRVTEPGGKRVKINLPLSLVRAIGDWPIDLGCRHRLGEDRACSTVRLSEVLAALDRGESLVEIEDEGKTVRVWVE